MGHFYTQMMTGAYRKDVAPADIKQMRVYEVEDLMPLARSLKLTPDMIQQCAFPPADLLLLELGRIPDNGEPMENALLIRHRKGPWAAIPEITDGALFVDVFSYYGGAERYRKEAVIIPVPYRTEGDKLTVFTVRDKRDEAVREILDESVFDVAIFTLCIFTLMNSPKVVRADTLAKDPKHRSLEVRSMKKFNPVTRIYLHVTERTEDQSEGGPVTGKRAYHFVRRFMRFKHGRLEMVSPHWRGDPNKGTVNRPYKVSP